MSLYDTVIKMVSLFIFYEINLYFEICFSFTVALMAINRFNANAIPVKHPRVSLQVFNFTWNFACFQIWSIIDCSAQELSGLPETSQVFCTFQFYSFLNFSLLSETWIRLNTKMWELIVSSFLVSFLGEGYTESTFKVVRLG